MMLTLLLPRRINHYRKQEFCRQPKLTANTWKADGKGFAVSSTTANQLSARQSAVSCFAVSLKSTDGNGFAVSHFAHADGKASRTASPDLTAVGWVNGVLCRQPAVQLTAKHLPGPTWKYSARWCAPSLPSAVVGRTATSPLFAVSDPGGWRQRVDQMVTCTSQVAQFAATCRLCRQLADGNAFAVSKLTAKLSVPIFLVCFL